MEDNFIRRIRRRRGPRQEHPIERVRRLAVHQRLPCLMCPWGIRRCTGPLPRTMTLSFGFDGTTLPTEELRCVDSPASRLTWFRAQPQSFGPMPGPQLKQLSTSTPRRIWAREVGGIIGAREPSVLANVACPPTNPLLGYAGQRANRVHQACVAVRRDAPLQPSPSPCAPSPVASAL